ncbi:MAG TPA: M3 family metallopeptidase [Polyangiaceae bacterium]|nr:M3 family metallopeptidase [Polyangiaceae bacterium]
MSLLSDLNRDYLRLHVAKEDAFWAQKMGLRAYVAGTFESAEIALRDFTSNDSWLPCLESELALETLSPDERTGLIGWRRFFEANALENADARRLQNELIGLEGELERSRGGMKLGYRDPDTGQHVAADYLTLSLTIRTDEREPVRRAAHEGMKAIEAHVLSNGFLDVVKQRNRIGRLLGYEDYYDFKVSRNEGFGKKRLFELLGELERDTRGAGKRAIAALAKEKGEGARLAHNYPFFSSGSLTAEVDPYFPFASALGRWGRSFMNMGVRYHGSTLTLDLLSRAGKYENGFMHGPFPGYVDQGKYLPARINFTSMGAPGQVGSGFAQLQTLFHEGGHAAHFSNIFMPAPCFSQEFAPTSVAYAETQSMFMDSLVADADWRRRYAKDRSGTPMPRALVRKGIEQKQRFYANTIRQMLVVPYVERAIYEMNEAELTPENVIAAAREIEQSMLFLSECPRPTLSVPHLLSGEASAYYHGYVLAEMAVHQTRAFFLGRDGHLLDNPKIGPDLARSYWMPGNSRTFLDLVQDLTGAPFSAQALVREANREVEEALEQADRALDLEKEIPRIDQPIDLGARIALIHGDERIADNFGGEAFGELEERFGDWLKSARL